MGYFKNPEATAETITADGSVRTGDKGQVDEKNRLKITGRTKELFKTSKGKYVAPAPIENILNDDPNVELSLVGGSGQVMPMAIVQLAEGLLKKCESDPELKTKITNELTALVAKANSQIE